MWLHLAESARIGAALQIVERLAQSRPGLCFLLSGAAEAAPGPVPLPQNAIWTRMADLTAAEASVLMAHWRPDAGLWIGWSSEGALVQAAQEVGVRLMLVEADSPPQQQGPRRWLRDQARLPWAAFERIHARTATAARTLQRHGAPQALIEVSGPLQDAPLPPHCNEPDREALMETLGGRPVWFADGVSVAEEEMILAAHNEARRAAQRLLLVIRPADPERVPQLMARIGANSRSVVADWTEGAWPDRQTDVLVVDGLGEAGLWIRVAALTYVGGTLRPDRERPSGDPRIAAALGSVVLHGPRTEHHRAAYDQLDAAGACRLVRSAAALGAALQQLLAPDRAAALALAAWEVLSEGAELTDRVVEEVQDWLDSPAGDAAT